MNYTHLTLEERYQIRDATQRGDGPRRIGKAMGRHRSTIERELQRNVGSARYEARSAHALGVARSSASNARPRLTNADWEQVDDGIRDDWRPEQISGRRRLDGLAAVSPEWIYQHIEKDHRANGTLSPHLRCRKQRRKRYGAARKRRFGSRRSIHDRPKVVEQRIRVGDWEAGTMRFAKGRAVAFTAIERKVEPHDSVEHCRGLGVDVIAGEARLVSPAGLDRGHGPRQVCGTSCAAPSDGQCAIRERRCGIWQTRRVTMRRSALRRCPAVVVSYAGA